MIDLHCHLLPGIDDGAADLATALAMARAAVADGVHVIACTPHIYPGLYDNDSDGIRRAVAQLAAQLKRRQIPLQLVIGADVHLAPDLPERLHAGKAPTLHGSRYLLLEPPHHAMPPRFESAVFELATLGYVPVITHPERLTWIEGHYDVFRRLTERGVWMQLTAGALAGRFGRRPRYWGERLLDEGCAHLLATDAHDNGERAPRLAEGRDAAARRVGDAEAQRLVLERPQAILRNLDPALAALPTAAAQPRTGTWRRVQELFAWQ